MTSGAQLLPAKSCLTTRALSNERRASGTRAWPRGASTCCYLRSYLFMSDSSERLLLTVSALRRAHRREIKVKSCWLFERLSEKWESLASLTLTVRRVLISLCASPQCDIAHLIQMHTDSKFTSLHGQVYLMNLTHVWFSQWESGSKYFVNPCRGNYLRSLC